MNKINNWYDHYNTLIYDQIDSTNDEAKRIAIHNSQHETLIWSYIQTKGRGRKDNVWNSGPNDLTFSILLYPKCTPKQSIDLVFLSGICMLQAIEEHVKEGLHLELKWPNDILLNGKKICGILLETSLKASNPEEINWLVVGIGVNNVSHPQLDKQITATNLLSEGYNILPDQLLSTFMQNFHYHINNWYSNGFLEYRKIWLKHAYRLGHQVSIRQADTTVVQGKFVDLDSEGMLVIEEKNGKLHHITSGEIHFED